MTELANISTLSDPQKIKEVIWQKAENAINVSSKEAIDLSQTFISFADAADGLSIESRLAAGKVLRELKDRTKKIAFEKALSSGGLNDRRAAELIDVFERFGNNVESAVKLGWTKCVNCCTLSEYEAQDFLNNKKVRGISFKEAENLTSRQLKLAFASEENPLEKKNKELFNIYQNSLRKLREAQAELKKRNEMPVPAKLRLEASDAIEGLLFAAGKLEDLEKNIAMATAEDQIEVRRHIASQIKTMLNKLNQNIGSTRAKILKEEDKEEEKETK